MLETLRIKDLAIIDSAEIHFKQGLNILSGETGAGKSIVIQAISLLLGSRASTELIRSGSDQAVVEGLFDLKQQSWVNERLEQLGFESDSNLLLIKRIIQSNGRHRTYVNGELATLGILAQLCEGLVDLCGQHEHQSLLKPLVQLEVLDRYGGLSGQAERVAASFKTVRDLRKEFEELRETGEDENRRADYLRFQVNELKSAELEPGEDEKLQQEKRMLQSTQMRFEIAGSLRQIFEHDESGVLENLRKSVSKFRALGDVDEKAKPLISNLENILDETEQFSLEVNRYLETIEFDEGRNEEIRDRLATIANLKRKYGSTVAEMIVTLNRLQQELEKIDHTEVRLEELTRELEDSEAELYSQGKKLSGSRKKVAKILGDSVTAELQDLNMNEAVFEVHLESHEDLANWSAQAGADQIYFMIQPNPGEPSKSMAKIASGGELSRVMLGIRRTIGDKGRIGVYLFDEIDSGMGGKTAFEVGKKLKTVSKHNQVICITHLPQVASFADWHLTVQKTKKNKRTITEVKPLEKQGRKEEIARMLGGTKPTSSSLRAAGELIKQAAL